MYSSTSSPPSWGVQLSSPIVSNPHFSRTRLEAGFCFATWANSGRTLSRSRSADSAWVAIAFAPVFFANPVANLPLAIQQVAGDIADQLPVQPDGPIEHSWSAKAAPSAPGRLLCRGDESRSSGRLLGLAGGQIKPEGHLQSRLAAVPARYLAWELLGIGGGYGARSIEIIGVNEKIGAAKADQFIDYF